MTEDNKIERAQMATPPQGGTPKVNWDASQMKSSYANVCNISFTREEVVLLFGINQAWQSGQKEVTVQLTDRIILTPFAARRMMRLLDAVLRQYEQRFGAMKEE